MMQDKASESVAQLVSELKIFVYSGLLEFWQTALPANAPVFQLLEMAIRDLTGSQDLPGWQQSRQRMEETLASCNRSLPLLQLRHDYQLTLSQFFSLGLVGEVEASHVVNLAISELQKPEQNARPSMHLLSAMLEVLFDDHRFTVFDIAEQNLVQHRLLRLQGDCPLPLQCLSIEPALWSILCGRNRQWPLCTALPDAQLPDLPQQARVELAKLAALLDDNGSHAALGGVVLRGNPNSGRRGFASLLARELAMQAVLLPVDLWARQPAIAAACRYGKWLPVIETQVAPGESVHFPEQAQRHPVLILTGADGAIIIRDCLELTMPLPTQQERQQIWRSQIQSESLSKTLAASALLSTSSIRIIASSAMRYAQQNGVKLQFSHVAEARGKLGVEKLHLLAQPVHSRVTADALVMPQSVAEGLHAVVLRARKREVLWNGLGATLKATPNPGVRVLFVGESGTGKTLAASYIATDLSAPLFRVDLSAVMNKYIGESEKNLAQLLDHAAANDVVLLFDEADALFGTRSEGKETGERFANMLTNFLLTRIECHPGIVILTTNSRERIDNAFSRRIDVVVEFPLPGYQERLQLWRSHLGDRGPGEQVYRNLASFCDLSGGQVRNVVLGAAVHAREDRISEENLWMGLRAEYNKLGRDMPSKLNFLAAPLSAA